uniref:Uncharacterized protein n=1 Tax=Scherffelia dubia TaxID=3190 RepID=A0A142BYF6_SCHDU|nr:hypothetical protein [Scherffelia dubia]AMP43448.1 hypothetical protein [Scherffelia dubia]
MVFQNPKIESNLIAIRQCLSEVGIKSLDLITDLDHLSSPSYYVDNPNDWPKGLAVAAGIGLLGVAGHELVDHLDANYDRAVEVEPEVGAVEVEPEVGYNAEKNQAISDAWDGYIHGDNAMVGIIGLQVAARIEANVGHNLIENVPYQISMLML